MKMCCSSIPELSVLEESFNTCGMPVCNLKKCQLNNGECMPCKLKTHPNGRNEIGECISKVCVVSEDMVGE